MGSVAVPSYTWYKYPVPCWCFWTFKVNRADPLQTFEFLEIYLPSLFLDCLCNHLVQLLFSYWVVSDSFVTLWTVACQAPLFMAFSWQEYWSELPFPSSRDLPEPGIEPPSPALTGGFFMTKPPWEYQCIIVVVQSLIVSNSLRPHWLQHARPPCPSLSPRVCSISCPLSWWCYPTISSSFTCFSSCLNLF